MNFCFDFLQELLMVWEAISNIRKGVSSDIQTPWSWLKKTRLRLVFSTTSRCLDIGWNTLPRVWYITSSPFECRITIVKYCDRFQPAWKWDQILWIDVYLQIVACKLKNLSDFTPDINFSSSEAGRRRLWSLVNLDQFGRVKKVSLVLRNW